MSKNLLELPADLPVPEDDGAAAHLNGMRFPDIALPSTAGGAIVLSRLSGRSVVYAYPRTGVPGEASLDENWEMIPGARGCTPQSCAFRDHHGELGDAGARVFGLSTQDTAFQRAAVERLHLPFQILSDDRLELTRALDLPVMVVADVTLMKRFTLVIRDGVIEHVFYPVFPPDRHAEAVLGWLRENPA
ncbi:MAG: peroxiredoxin [Hyphomicrobiaceae bacterium]|nr:peroxiredoxin [Hyphomicrobiaceae bacterium]